MERRISVRTEKQIREDVLKEPIGDIIAHLHEDLELADNMRDSLKMFEFANYINTINQVIDLFVAVDMEIEQENS